MSLLVWNRSPGKYGKLTEAGATVAANPAEVFSKSQTIVMMLRHGAAMDESLARGQPEFKMRVRGRTVINMATTEPAYSKALETDIRSAGGRYVEAPVSGSRKPAEDGQLAAMLAGDPSDVEAVRYLLTPMCKESIVCGAVPSALYMKLAVNLFMINMVTGLAEATHFAQRHGLNIIKFVRILGASPMASDVSRVKASKLLAGDFGPQAAISNVLENNSLIVDAARAAGIASPLIDVCHALYRETEARGLGGEDMVAVIRAIEERTAAGRWSPS